MNSRGQIFPIYLVILTAFLIGFVFFASLSFESSISNDLTSPEGVLDVASSVKLLDFEEELLVRSCASKILNSDNFLEDFEKEFFSRIIGSSEDAIQFRSLMFDNLVLNGVEADNSLFDSLSERESFFETIYSFEFLDNTLRVHRDVLTKEFLLKATEEDKIDFPIEMSYSFSRDFSLDVSDLR